MIANVFLSEIGSRAAAKMVFDRLLGGSRAYADLVSQAVKGLGKTTVTELAWAEIPTVTKKEFFSSHSWRELVPQESYNDIYSLIRSSGTSTANKNRGFFWPQLKSVDARMEPALHSAITQTFRLQERKTLVIIGLSLGSWAGGEQYSFVFKTLALRSNFPLVVFSPGNQHQEILEIIEKCHTEFDQIIIGVCPSAIFYLERMAQQAGTPFPLDKISFLVTGEPFPEAMRQDLHQRSGQNGDRLAMLSVYGSADTGFLGVESLPLARVRQFLCQHADVAESLGFPPTAIPNLYHAQTQDVLLEVVNDELLVTKWQGLPLVRYNLEDRVAFYSWKSMCETIALADAANASIWKSFGSLPLSDVLAVYGRTQGCVFLCGSNVFESMLQQVILQSTVRDSFTGTFVAWSEVEHGQQRLHWQIEMKPGQPIPTAGEADALHAEFVALLSEQQPEFGEDYEKFYRSAEAQGLRIFSFHFCQSPHLSQHSRFKSATKRKIIIEKGPL